MTIDSSQLQAIREPLSKERVSNYRNWCAARVGSLSGADIGVALADLYLDSLAAPQSLKESELASLLRGLQFIQNAPNGAAVTRADRDVAILAIAALSRPRVSGVEQSLEAGDVAAIRDAANYLSELYAKYGLKIGPFSSQAQKHNVYLNAIAARLSSGDL